MCSVPFIFCRARALRCVFGNIKFCSIAVCMPAPWHSDDGMEQVHNILDIHITWSATRARAESPVVLRRA